MVGKIDKHANDHDYADKKASNEPQWTATLGMMAPLPG
jgi:hypothetical protein